MKIEFALLEKELETSVIKSGTAKSLVYKLFDWGYCRGDGIGKNGGFTLMLRITIYHS